MQCLYPLRNDHISHLGKKKNHLEKCLGRGNVSWQEGSLEMLKICLKYATALFLILLPCDHVWPRLREDVSRYWHVGFEWLGMVQFQSWEMRVAWKEVLVWGCDLKIAWSCTTTWHTSELHRWYLYVFVVVALSSSPLGQAHEVHQQLGTKSAAYARLCFNMALAKQAQLEFGIEIYNDMTGALHVPAALLIVDGRRRLQRQQE